MTNPVYISIRFLYLIGAIICCGFAIWFIVDLPSGPEDLVHAVCYIYSTVSLIIFALVFISIAITG